MIRLHPCQHERYAREIALAEAIVVIICKRLPNFSPNFVVVLKNDVDD